MKIFQSINEKNKSDCYYNDKNVFFILLYNSSEEAQEHINKFLIAYQLQHCRQMNYIIRNTDLVNRCIEQSDPLVLASFERPNKSGDIKAYPQEVKDLCKSSDEILESMVVKE